MVGIGVRKADRCFEGEHVVREGLEGGDFEVKARRVESSQPDKLGGRAEVQGAHSRQRGWLL